MTRGSGEAAPPEGRQLMGRTASLAILVAAISLLLLPGAALAAGVGAAPGELRFDRGTRSSQVLHVINTGDDETRYRVYADDGYDTWFTVSPAELSLKPGDSEEVLITISPPPEVVGEFTTNICIVSLEPSSGFKVGLGVKVPAYISLTIAQPAPSPPAFPWWIALAIVVPLVLMGSVLGWRRKSGNVPA